MRSMLRGIFLTFSLCAALALAACGEDSSTQADMEAGSPQQSPQQEQSQQGGEGGSGGGKPSVSVPDGQPPKELQVREIEEGDGAVAEAGDEVTVQYVGVLYRGGKQFDASWDRGEPFTFTLGGAEVIPGWERGVEGMKVGGRRELIIPPDLAYGSQAVGPIPPNSTLVFVVDLEAVG